MNETAKAIRFHKPKNPNLPFYSEDTPDQLGYTANPVGARFVDFGAGGFLRHGLQSSAEQNPNSLWEVSGSVSNLGAIGLYSPQLVSRISNLQA